MTNQNRVQLDVWWLEWASVLSPVPEKESVPDQAIRRKWNPCLSPRNENIMVEAAVAEAEIYDELFYLEDTYDLLDWYNEVGAAPSEEGKPTPSAEGDSAPSAEENLKALHQYNDLVVEKITELAKEYPEDSKIREIYEECAKILSEPLP